MANSKSDTSSASWTFLTNHAHVLLCRKRRFAPTFSRHMG